MKKIRRLFLLIASILYMSGIFCQTIINPDPKTSTVLIRYRTAITNAWMSSNFNVVKNYYAEDIRLMPEFQKAILGKKNLMQYYAAFSERFTMQGYKRNETEVLDLGSRVVEFGSFEMKLKHKSSGKEYLLKGKYEDIWQKFSGDSLLLITQLWNYSHHLENNEIVQFSQIPSVTIAFNPRVPVDNSISFELAALSRLQEVCITQHDPIIWSQFYSDDAKVFFNFEPVCEGREAIDSYMKKHVQELPVFEKLDIRQNRIDHLGNFVIVYASHIAICRNGDWSGVSTGKNVAIWRRQPDGSLKIFRAFATYD